MDDSSDEEMMIAYYYYHTKRNKRRFWVHPYIERNFHHRLFVAARELNLSDAKFLCFYRMSKDSYLQLVQLISPAIHKKDIINYIITFILYRDICGFHNHYPLKFYM